MKKILILEDNPATLEHLSGLVGKIDKGNMIYPMHSREEAYTCALEKDIDLFMVDIILDKKIPYDSSGLRFVESIRGISRYEFTPVIFITALEDARMYTYENLHCYGFLEKPFDEERLLLLVKQCLRYGETPAISKSLYFRKDGIIIAVERNDIVYVKSNRHILYIHTKQGEVIQIPYVSLKRIIENLEGAEFVQCSRSVIINKRYVLNIDFTNRIIQLKDGYGRIELGTAFKVKCKDIFLTYGDKDR